jgi:hypothetical protein
VPRDSTPQGPEALQRRPKQLNVGRSIRLYGARQGCITSLNDHRCRGLLRVRPGVLSPSRIVSGSGAERARLLQETKGLSADRDCDGSPKISLRTHGAA